jgi:hypothetical protein
MSRPIAVFEPSTRCRLCVMIVQDPTIKAKVESSSAFIRGGRSGNSLQRELGITPTGWQGHLKRHHYPMHKRDFQKDAALVIEAQGKLIDRETAIKDNFESSWDSIIDEGNRLVASGQMRVTSSMLIAAARDKAAYQAKKQDRKLDIAKMVYAFASGNKKETDAEGITPESTVSPDEG